MGLIPAHQVDQFAIHNPDDHLTGAHRLQDLLAHRLLSNALAELLRDVIVDVRFQQCIADLRHPVAYVFLRQRPSRQLAQGVAETLRNAFKHRSILLPVRAL